MKLSKFFAITSTALTGALADYAPPDDWSTLTARGVYPAAISSYWNTFGIIVEPLTSSVILTPATTTHVVSQIDDGQIQNTNTAYVGTTKHVVVSQIDDGQIQATASAIPLPTELACQYEDGQIQATAPAGAPATPGSQIQSGQVHETPSVNVNSHSESQTRKSESQSPETGFIPGTLTTVLTSTGDDTTVTLVTVETELTTYTPEVTVTINPNAAKVKRDRNIAAACLTPEALGLTLKDAILLDLHGRVGSIVSNRQFQFDGPPPQAGAIYAVGWSITPNGYLALGDSEVFYQCLSGSFYNLYDQHIAEQCESVHLKVVDLISC